MNRTDTKMQGFDTIVAITQKAINANLQALWDLEIIKHDLNITLPRGLGILTAKVNAPIVKIKLEDDKIRPLDGLRYVYFILNLPSGNFATKDNDNNDVNIPFDNSKIGFKVNLDLQDTNFSKLPQKVKDKIKNLDKGMFSIRRLFMDFQNANLANPEPQLTKFPKELLDDAFFTAALQQYFKHLKNKEEPLTLGYAIKVNNPNNVDPVAPSFPPTDLNFATHIYKSESDRGEENPNIDALYYLLMTQHRKFPPSDVYPMGNFVDQPDTDGTMAISKLVFVDQFLLPTLAQAINSYTKIEGGSKGVSIFHKTGKPFTRTTSDGAEYYSEPSTLTYSRKEMIENSWHTWKASHYSKVKIENKTNKIHLQGSSVMYYSVTYFCTSWVEVKVDWRFVLGLVAHKDGRLELNILEKDQPPPSKKDSMCITAPLDRRVIDNFIKGLEINVTSVSSQLNQKLESCKLQNRFIFPGGGEFYFKDPLFNNELDLLATISIKFY